MNTFTKILVGLLAIIALLVIGFFIYANDAPKRLDVERSVIVDASPETVYAQIADLQNWERWSPWQAKDTSMKIIYGTQTSGEGASYSWESEKMGSGKLTVLEARPNKYQKNLLEFTNQGISHGIWKLEKTEDQKTRLTWKIISPEDLGVMERGMMKMMNAEGHIIEDFDEGLANIKEIAESQPKAPSIQVMETEVHGVPYWVYRGTVSMDDKTISEFLERGYGSIFQTIEVQPQDLQGVPSSLMYTWDENTKKSDMAAAIPMEAPNFNNQTIKTKVGNEAGELHIYDHHVSMDYYGPYHDMYDAHNAINKWLGENDKTIVLPVVEEYLNDPQEVEPEEIHTRIYYFFE